MVLTLAAKEGQGRLMRSGASSLTSIPRKYPRNEASAFVIPNEVRNLLFCA